MGIWKHHLSSLAVARRPWKPAANRSKDVATRYNRTRYLNRRIMKPIRFSIGVAKYAIAFRWRAGNAEQQQQQLALERDREPVASDMSQSTMIGVTVRSNNDDDAKKTQKIIRKRSKTFRKLFKTTWKSLENVRKLYVFGWAHCFGLFWNFRINMEFDTLVLHLSVVVYSNSSSIRVPPKKHPPSLAKHIYRNWKKNQH